MHEKDFYLFGFAWQDLGHTPWRSGSHRFLERQHCGSHRWLITSKHLCWLKTRLNGKRSIDKGINQFHFSPSCRFGCWGSFHMIASKRRYLASCESSEDFLFSPHHTSCLLNSENYSASNYRTLIKAGVAENGKGTLPWHFCNKKNDIPHLARVWRKKMWQDNGYDGMEGQRASCTLINTALLLCDKYDPFGKQNIYWVTVEHRQH